MDMDERIALAKAARDVLARRDLTASAKLAYLFLAARSGERVSAAEAARSIGVSGRTWTNAMSALRRAGLVESTRRGFGGPVAHRVVLPEVGDDRNDG